MRITLGVSALIVSMLLLNLGCNTKTESMNKNERAIFLHHSTGNNVWKGNPNKFMYKLFKTGDFEKAFAEINKKEGTKYSVTEMHYPIGHDNMPFDYYNIWVKNAGSEDFENNATLETLSKNYGTIIWKHCFPVSSISESEDSTASVESNKKTLANYKLQYEALKKKMHEFKDTKFIVWTAATHVAANTNEEQAKRTQEFVKWVAETWNEKGDNIYLWDFYSLETEGGLYLKDNYAYSTSDSHPNKEFSARVSKLFANRIYNVMCGNGDNSSLTGK